MTAAPPQPAPRRALPPPRHLGARRPSGGGGAAELDAVPLPWRPPSAERPEEPPTVAEPAAAAGSAPADGCAPPLRAADFRPVAAPREPPGSAPCSPRSAGSAAGLQQQPCSPLRVSTDRPRSPAGGSSEGSPRRCAPSQCSLSEAGADPQLVHAAKLGMQLVEEVRQLRSRLSEMESSSAGADRRCQELAQQNRALARRLWEAEAQSALQGDELVFMRSDCEEERRRLALHMARTRENAAYCEGKALHSLSEVRMLLPFGELAAEEAFARHGLVVAEAGYRAQWLDSAARARGGLGELRVCEGEERAARRELAAARDEAARALAAEAVETRPPPRRCEAGAGGDGPPGDPLAFDFATHTLQEAWARQFGRRRATPARRPLERTPSPRVLPPPPPSPQPQRRCQTPPASPRPRPRPCSGCAGAAGGCSHCGRAERCWQRQQQQQQRPRSPRPLSPRPVVYQPSSPPQQSLPRRRSEPAEDRPVRQRPPSPRPMPRTTPHGPVLMTAARCRDRSPRARPVSPRPRVLREAELERNPYGQDRTVDSIMRRGLRGCSDGGGRSQLHGGAWEP